MKRLLILTSVLYLSACGLFSAGCVRGDPFAIFVYCGNHIDYPTGARWFKEGMTRESRKQDWIECGGRSDLLFGFRPWITPEPYEIFAPQRDAHVHQVWMCMRSKGYRFLNPEHSGKADECSPEICLYP